MNSVAFAIATVFCIICGVQSQYPFLSSNYMLNKPTFSGTVSGCIVCTRRAVFRTEIDGIETTAKCSSGNNVLERCPGCCSAFAIYNGKQGSDAAGFLGNDGSCVCCIPC